ncbi:hypothetical protein N8T08_001739 [Aspergillus melleus]|uniref:Uncharacterized protein n=1 Tax=Aspergillus melleus TaxID=138277 RepID=A0ACC3AMU3_9EURO|nr:hypothetical protein N8T08_001739 [Aspergillus melleus]
MDVPGPASKDHLGKTPDRPTKRRKIAVACDECRTRKVRCDGIQPVCGPCMKRSDQGVQCVYTGEPEKKRAVRNYIATLESRIRHLESPECVPTTVESNLGDQCSDHSPRFISPQNSESHLSYNLQRHRRNIPSTSAGGQPSSTYNVSPGSSLAGAQGPSFSPSQNLPDQPLRSEKCEDGVNAMMGAVEEGRPTQGFFGSSSAASFMRQIKQAVDKRVSSPCRPASDSVLGVAPSPSLVTTKAMPSTVPSYVLPPRKTADSLMGVYWCYVFPLYPLVDGLHLRAEYARIWTGEALESDKNMLMCTFNVIFALASQLADFIPPDERESSADTFFSRAKGLFQFNLWNTGSVGLTQCLLLMAQYLQSTDCAHQCWVVTGLAVRNAQSLGLHLPQTVCRLRNPQEQQLARKIWHGCVLMDRVISMTFGRPAMISKASSGSVPLPVAVDEEHIPTDSGAQAKQPTDRPSIMAFYAKSLELYEIMNDILLSLYNKPVPDESPEDMYDFYFDKEISQGERTIFDLDRALSRWTRALPLHLRDPSSLRSDNMIFLRQGVVLRARFLHVRMLLFRPVLSKYCTARDIAVTDPLFSLVDSFPHRVALQCSVICVKVAQEVIDLIRDNIPTDGSSGPLPAWWYNILYVYTAATVLIAGRLCPSVVEEITDVAISRSWNYALGILRKYQSYSTSARRCVAALEILYQSVASEAPPSYDQPPSTTLNATNDMSLGEGMNAILIDGFDLTDFQDMSWLNSVPSSLY